MSNGRPPRSRRTTSESNRILSLDLSLTQQSPKNQYTAAAKTSTIDPTARALETLHRAFQSDAKLTAILTTPTLSDADKSMLVSELVRTSGAPASDKTIPNFLKTLAENNRLNLLRHVCEKFAELMSAHRGEVEMQVTSAAPLDGKVLRQLEGAVGKSQYVGQGKKLKVTSKVSPRRFVS